MRQRRPRRKKTLADVVALQGTEYWQDERGITLSLVDTMQDQMIYLGDLLGKFYRINEGQNPLVFTLMDDKAQAIPEKVWYAVMRGNFYIEIIINTRSTPGPHQTKLWFKSFTTKETFWIASLQLEAFYYNETEMQEALIKAIEAREFFMTEKEREKAIVP